MEYLTTRDRNYYALLNTKVVLKTAPKLTTFENSQRLNIGL